MWRASRRNACARQVCTAPSRCLDHHGDAERIDTEGTRLHEPGGRLGPARPRRYVRLLTITWGAFTPHGGIGEFRGWTAADAWARLRDYAVAVDELGYDHLWTSDHLMSMIGDSSGMHFEAFTQLAALSQVTTRVKLGQLVTCAPYRNAALLAKQAANVDICSGGRLILGLGGGWYEREFAAFGYPFPSPGGRFTAFAETIEAVTRLWREDTVDFDGTFVQLAGASCSPRPASMPPIWTGAHGPRGLEVAARFADVANFNLPHDRFVESSTVLGAACERVGRMIETSVFRFADLSGGGATARLLELQGAPPGAADAMREDHFIGSADEVTAKVQAFVDAGCRHIVIMALDAETSMDTTERFLREVVPNVSEPS